MHPERASNKTIHKFALIAWDSFQTGFIVCVYLVEECILKVVLPPLKKSMQLLNMSLICAEVSLWSLKVPECLAVFYSTNKYSSVSCNTLYLHYVYSLFLQYKIGIIQITIYKDVEYVCRM